MAETRRFLIAASAGLISAAALAGSTSPPVGDLSKVGKVQLHNSCDPAVQKEFDRGVALLHSFFYVEARRSFTAVATQDPKCAIAQWGIAMTLWHPIWTPPSDAEMKDGRAAITAAKTIGGKTDVERGFIQALEAFYLEPPKPGTAGPVAQTCHGPAAGTHRGRAIAYEKAMEKLFAKRPDDVEVATFYSLALLGSADPTDRTLANQLKAAKLLERHWKANHDHPGIAHYLIHAYDYPPVAEKGLPAARAFAAIAPWVPHVLHMPSHIFVRLGMWQDVIDSNLASADASRKYAATAHPNAASFEELHALDYMVYAYLHLGRDDDARSVLARVNEIERTFPETDFAAAYALGAIPARFALERRQWAEAAALQIKPMPHWAPFPFGEANLTFARGIGLARTGKAEQAREAAARIGALAKAITNPGHKYFALQAEMQQKVVLGWAAAAEGDKAQAEKLLREAADTDDALGKHPVSPGSLLPAREMYADFLLDTGKPAEALAAYQETLKLNPRRFSGVHGAARAAAAAGNADVARKHYADLVAMAGGTSRPEVAQAREFLSAR
jgi:tetratricopeptide (TPR) repeat protein